nr:hypothetical protein [Tanacetum cinerariifolium]
AQTTTNNAGTSTTHIPGPVTTQEKAQKKNNVKARSMLPMALPNEHLMTFNQYQDAKTLFAATETRFGRNEATSNTQKTLLKQLYENFSATSTESLDLNFNRLQKIRNKSNLDTISINDLYTNFKIIKQKVKGTTITNISSQNMAFVSTSSHNNTNEVPTNFGISTTSPQVSTANLSDTIVYAFLANQLNGSHLVHEDLEQIHEDDMEEMDLKWQLALLNGAFCNRMLSAKELGEQNQEPRKRKKDSECKRHIFQSNGGLLTSSQPEGPFKEELLGIIDLMIQKSNRMKQKDQSRHYGTLQAGGEHEEFLKIWSKI